MLRRALSSTLAGRRPRFRARVSVHFKAAWLTPFSPHATRKETFHTPTGPVKADLMGKTGSMSYLENDQFQAVALPYEGNDLEGKRLELIKELLPGFSRVVVFSNPTNPYCIVAVNSARHAAAVLHVELDVLDIPQQIEALQRTAQGGERLGQPIGRRATGQTLQYDMGGRCAVAQGSRDPD